MDNNAITPAQLGQIEMTEEMVFKRPESARRLLTALGFVPIKIEHALLSRRVYYTGISSRFDALTEGMYIPRYTITLRDDPDGELAISCIRCPDGAVNPGG